MASNGGIDCKINGAYVLMGLLDGRRNPDQTMGNTDNSRLPGSRRIGSAIILATMIIALLPTGAY